MIKTVSRIGESKQLIIDSTLLELAHLSAGDKVNVTVFHDGTLVLTPVGTIVDPTRSAASAKHLVGKNKQLFPHDA